MSADFDIFALETSVTDALLADPFFSGLPALSGAAIVISDDPHVILTQIQAALNEIGLGILVLNPSAHVVNPNEPGPYFDKIHIVVKIFENPTINRAATNNDGNNPTCYDTAINVCRVLHLFQPNGVDECLMVTDMTPVADEDLLIYQIVLTTKAGLNFTQRQIAPVVASPTTPGNQTVTLSCATTGAAIFYTLDGAYPAPRQPTAQLYTGPVTVTAGQRLWARAWLAGYAPTQPAETSIQY